jgi:hypothetical protein
MGHQPAVTVLNQNVLMDLPLQNQPRDKHKNSHPVMDSSHPVMDSSHPVMDSSHLEMVSKESHLVLTILNQPAITVINL